VDFANPAIIKLTDVGGWGHDATMHHPIVEDTLGALKLNVKRQWMDSSATSRPA
jgi:iron complex outermembrane receptor protein